jgi:hypothetical protein
MTDTILDQEIEQEIPVIEEPAPQPPKFSGLLHSIYPDGTIGYGDEVGLPEDFPLTEAELAEVSNPNTPVYAPPTPNYIAFWDALTTSTVYAAIREQSIASLPMNTLATELIALLGDAKAGRANEVAIQASMAAILTTGTFTAAQLTELQTALVAGHLESIYALV